MSMCLAPRREVCGLSPSAWNLPSVAFPDITCEHLRRHPEAQNDGSAAPRGLDARHRLVGPRPHGALTVCVSRLWCVYLLMRTCPRLNFAGVVVGGCRDVGVCAGRARGPPCLRGARADACRQASQMPALCRAIHADRSRARKRRAHVSVWARPKSGTGHVLGRVGGGGGVHAAGMPQPGLEPQAGRRYRQVCYSHV